MDYTDAGLWLHGVSDAAGSSIKQAVFTFRATHGLDDGASHIRAYGVSRGYLDVWIGTPPSPTYREPYSILDDKAAGPKLLEVLEHCYTLSVSPR
jgi:hypothetical protein